VDYGDLGLSLMATGAAKIAMRTEPPLMVATGWPLLL